MIEIEIAFNSEKKFKFIRHYCIVRAWVEFGKDYWYLPEDSFEFGLDYALKDVKFTFIPIWESDERIIERKRKIFEYNDKLHEEAFEESKILFKHAHDNLLLLFKEIIINPQQIQVLTDNIKGLYYFYNNNDLIYVGKSQNVKKRLNQHFHKTKGDYNTQEITKIMIKQAEGGFERCITKSYCDIIEFLVISVLKPKKNVIGKSIGGLFSIENVKSELSEEWSRCITNDEYEKIFGHSVIYSKVEENEILRSLAHSLRMEEIQTAEMHAAFFKNKVIK